MSKTVTGNTIDILKREIQAEKAAEGSANSDPSFEKKNVPGDPADLLEAFTMKESYVQKLGNEQFIFRDLLIKGHVVTVIAMSGGGKTTVFYYYICPVLAKQGLRVWYIDADSPASDHRRMKELADKHGIKLLNPDVNHGTTMEGLVENLRTIANSQADLTDWVFFIDTLKKAADLMSKGSVKNFYQLIRKLSNLGATVVLLGHANKYRDKEGNLVFEGVGDIRSDTDELIFLERKKNIHGGIDVTTVVDPERGAKVRGIFEPISFHISDEREVTLYENPLPLIDHTATSIPKATDDEIIEAARKYLLFRDDSVVQRQLVQYTADMTGTGKERVRKIIVQNSEPRDAITRTGQPFVFSVGDKNAHYFEVPK